MIYIVEDVSPRLEALHITGGNATDLGGDPWGRDGGGGVYVHNAAAVMSDCVVYGNSASTGAAVSGGGLALLNSATTLSGNTIVSNTATLNSSSIAKGGGFIRVGKWLLHLDQQPGGRQPRPHYRQRAVVQGHVHKATLGRLLQSTIAHNRGNGQGVYVDEYSSLTLTSNIIAGHHSVGIHVTSVGAATLEATL